MNNKLVQRYQEVDAELEVVRGMATENFGLEVVQKRMAELEAKQADLKKTLLHLIALSKLRDDAWHTLSYGQQAHL